MSDASVKDIYKKYPEIERDVSYLKDWLIKQTHLPSVTDSQLVTFLNSCNNSLEATKVCIDSYFTCKSGSPEFFSKRDPLDTKFQQECKVVEVVSLTARSPEGYRYIFTRLHDPEIANYHPDQAVRIFFMILDSALMHDIMSPGIVVISDMNNFAFGHMLKSNPVALKKMMDYVQYAMPVKLKAMHIINTSPVINSIMAFVKPFISTEFLQLLNFYATGDGVEDFYKIVPKKLLPSNYGGEDQSTHELFEKSLKDLQTNREWFLGDEERCKVDETKREGKLRNDGDLFGQQGSFKKLNLD